MISRSTKSIKIVSSSGQQFTMKNIITLVEQEKNQVDLKKKKKEKSIAIGREKNGLTACYDIFIALKRSENCPFSSACDGGQGRRIAQP